MQEQGEELPWSAERHRRVVRLCSAMTGDPHAAADLAQETYLQAARLSARPVADEIDPWVAAVARNVCRRWLHARARGAAREHLTPTLPETGAVEVEHEDLVVLLEGALALLPPDARDVLVARFVEGRSPSDIAATSGATPDAVAMRLTRAKRRLRHVLETAYAEETRARGWTSAAESGWRPTRVRCTRCGATALDMRHDEVSVQFRCRSCSLTRPATVVPRRGVLSGLVDGVVRPSAILARVARWNADYWAGPAATSPCPACGDPVPRRAYERDELTELADRHGWWTRCKRCDEEVSSSLLGIAAALPAVLEVRRRHPDLRLTQSARLERDGVDAVRLGFGRTDGRVLVTAIIGRDRPGLLHVVS